MTISALEIIIAVFAMNVAIFVAAQGRFLLACLFIAIALYCLTRTARARKNK